MGISDEDYAKALNEHYQQQAQAIIREQEKQRMMGAHTTTGALHYPAQQATIGIKPLREQDLKHDAMQAPLSSLADMWTMRWDNQWVNETEFMDDDFWRLALIRLLGANKLEKHNLVNQYHAVYRIIT
jgi:hypothetical protein